MGEERGEKRRKMSDTKVKVAVRVRPMNRRGKCVFVCARQATFLLSKLSLRFSCLLGNMYLSRHCCFRAWSGRLDTSSTSTSKIFSLSFLKALFCFALIVLIPHPPAALPPPQTPNLSSLCAEIELNTKCVVDMEDNQTVLHPPPSNAKGENR